MGKLQSLIEQLDDASLARKRRLQTLCDTRWVERHDAVQLVKELLPTIADLVEHYADEGDRTAAAEATTLLAALRSPEFIMGLVTASRGLSKTVGLSMALQSPTQHLGQAIRRVEQIKKELALDRDAAPSAFEEAERLADAVGAGALVPRRSVGRQTARSNAPATTSEEHFSRNCFLPFLDHLIVQLDERFGMDGDGVAQVIALQELIPFFADEDSTTKVYQAAQAYEADLLFPSDVIFSQIQTWMDHVIQLSPDEKQDLCLSRWIELSKSLLLPVITVLLRIYGTVPVSNASAERSFSVLKRLKTYLRSTMSQERLTGLALLAIHSDRLVSTDKVIARYAEMADRRVLLK